MENFCIDPDLKHDADQLNELPTEVLDEKLTIIIALLMKRAFEGDENACYALDGALADIKRGQAADKITT